MSILKPSTDSRIGISLNENFSDFKTSSIIAAVEVEGDSPFWAIHFGKRFDNGDGAPIDDRGTVILEESMIRDILNQIDFKKRRGVEEWVEYR